MLSSSMTNSARTNIRRRSRPSPLWNGAVGAGLDFGVTPNIVLGIDYVHGFMGARDNSFTFNAGRRTDRIRQDVDIVTARISYKFGGPVIAKY
jgi:outer membrane immunogenic protein